MTLLPLVLVRENPYLSNFRRPKVKTALKMGHPQAVSKNSADLVNILASGGQPIYLKTPRPVTVFQPPGNADQSPEDWSWFSTEEDGVFTWNKSCLMIPADCKDQFFLQAPYRLPGLTWTFNPELSLIHI